MRWELLADLGYWILFFLGQSLFVLNRASKAVRSPMNPATSRMAFIRNNWDILAVRLSVGELPIFWMWRHVSMATAFGWFAMPYPSWLPNGYASSWLAGFCLGYCSDSLLDWLGQYPRTPEVIKRLIKEQVPNYQVAPIVEVKTTTTIQGASTETHSEVKVTEDTSGSEK